MSDEPTEPTEDTDGELEELEPCAEHDICPECGGAHDLVAVPTEVHEVTGRPRGRTAMTRRAAEHWDRRLWSGGIR